MNIETFKQDYPAALRAAIQRYPQEYLTTTPADIVAERMIASIEKGGIGSVNINSHSFRTLAKRYGIRNTYKDWKAWLAA